MLTFLALFRQGLWRAHRQGDTTLTRLMLRRRGALRRHLRWRRCECIPKGTQSRPPILPSDAITEYVGMPPASSECVSLEQRLQAPSVGLLYNTVGVRSASVPQAALPAHSTRSWSAVARVTGVS